MRSILNTSNTQKDAFVTVRHLEEFRTSLLVELHGVIEDSLANTLATLQNFVQPARGRNGHGDGVHRDDGDQGEGAENPRNDNPFVIRKAERQPRDARTVGLQVCCS